MGGILGFLLVAFVLEEAGAEDFQGGGFVFLLRTSVLTADDFSGRDMQDLHSGVGGVDALSAGAAGAADFDAEVLRAKFDVDFLCFGKDGDRRRRGVDAALGFGGGDALHAVDAAFVAQAAEDGVADDFEDDFLEAAEAGRTGVDGLELESLRLGVALIHAVKIGSEEGGFIAAGAGADFDDGVAVFAFVGRKEGELDLAVEDGEAFFDLRNFGGGQLGHFGVGAGSELLVFGELGAKALRFAVRIGEFFKTRLFAHDIACFDRVVEKIVGRDELIQLGQAFAFFGDERGEVHEKKNGDRPRGGAITVSATNQLSFFGAGRFDRTVASGEFLDASGGVDELLFAGEERVAGCADADLDVFAGRARVVDRPAGAGDRRLVVFWMQIGFHGIEKV